MIHKISGSCRKIAESRTQFAENDGLGIFEHACKQIVTFV